MVEWWTKQQRDFVAMSDQMLFNRVHRARCTAWIRNARDDTPRLCDRIDLRFVARLGAEWCTVIEVRSPVPVTVPRIGLDSIRIPIGVLGKLVMLYDVSPFRTEREHPVDDRDEEPCEPDAFPFPFDSDTTETVVPIAASNQREVVHSEGTRFSQRTDTVIINGPYIGRDLRHLIDLMLIRIQLSHRQVRDLDVEYSEIARNIDVVINDIWEPYEIVGELRSHPTTGLRMPPVLDITLDELA